MVVVGYSLVIIYRTFVRYSDPTLGTAEQATGGSLERKKIIDWARDLYEDLDFNSVRGWLDANPAPCAQCHADMASLYARWR